MQKQTARLRWRIFSRLLQTGWDSYIYLYVRSCCVTVYYWMRESKMGGVFICNLITGKASVEAFTSVDSEVKYMEVTNPLGYICLWTCETSYIAHYFNSLYSRSKQVVEIFTVISWSKNCDPTAAPKEICLLEKICCGKQFKTGRQRKLLSNYDLRVLPVVREKSWTENVWSFGFHLVLQRGIIGALEKYLKCICESTGV